MNSLFDESLKWSAKELQLFSALLSLLYFSSWLKQKLVKFHLKPPERWRELQIQVRQYDWSFIIATLCSHLSKKAWVVFVFWACRDWKWGKSLPGPFFTG